MQRNILKHIWRNFYEKTPEYYVCYQWDAFLSQKNLNVVIHFNDERIVQIPLIGLEAILCFSYKGATPDLIGKCAELGIGFSFLTPRGKFLAQVAGRTQGNVLLRKEQYRISDSEERSCAVALS